MNLEDISRLNHEFRTKSPEEALLWTLDNLHPNVGLASSFGAEDVVVIDMMMRINPKARVFTLDTGRLNQETYDVIDEIRNKYKINIEVMFPNQDEVENMVRTHGMNLFYESIDNRKLCCGIRSDQTQNRAGADKFELDEQHGGILKVNPIIEWKWEQVLDYIKKNNIPYNKLHDKGYPSIGCEPCTRAIKPGEDLRAGRWWWENDPQKECGLHVAHGSG